MTKKYYDRWVLGMIDNEVVKYYENYREEDRITTNNARKIEFLTTIRKFDEVFKEKYEILDCAAGTGAYAFYLADKGHILTAADITPRRINMKQQKFFGIILIICTLLTLAGCVSTSTFDGSRVKNEGSYQLDIKTMNCTDTHTMELEQGDTLKIQFETLKGNLCMKITAPDGTVLYQGDGTVKEFTVEAPMDGAYPIVVVGQKAKGSIQIDVERVPEAVEPEGTQEPVHIR